MATLVHSINSLLPRSRSMQLAAAIVLLSVTLGLIALNSASAVAPSNEYFQRTWERTDKPIVDGVADRTWNWGPEAISNELSEPYADSPGGVRQVQYFDKSRMEINHPDADPNSIWYVTNGLLVVELMTGRMQVGDYDFQDRFPADVPVAGDTGDPNGVTYAVFADFRKAQPVAAGTVYTQRLHPDGTVTNEPGLAGYNVTSSHLDEVTNHRIAGPFWDYMNSSGPVYVDGQFINDLLFLNPFYSTGRPITEFYWVRSEVGGTEKDVGIQCFERRCLTFTPGNPAGFVVEDGNVGLHYFIWRYETPEPTPTATATSTATSTPSVTSTATSSPTATATMTSTATATMTPEEVEVDVSANVDCDGDGTIDSAADEVGADGVCSDFIGGEIETLTDGNEMASNEVQRLGLNDATGGSITISFVHPDLLGTIIVTGIPYDATAQDIQDALETGFMANGVGPDTPTVEPVSSDPDAQLNEAPMLFTFENGDLAGVNVSQMVVDNTPLVGETTAGTFSTVIQGAPAQAEVQQLLPNMAGDGTFTLSFDHPTAGEITTSQIPHDASATFIEFEIMNAFDDEGVGDDAPTVSGGPADEEIVTLTFENGDLAGINVPEFTVDNSDLELHITVSRVRVLDTGSTQLATWQVDSTGHAMGLLDPGEYEFCFTYSEDSGETDTDCSGIVEVSVLNDTFSLTAELDYN